jgi:tRNA C32,U32 (ribose-2'-O)-methylase TrmJ
MSPTTIDLIRKAVTHAAATTTGTRWALIRQAEFSRMAAEGRPDHRRRQELVALVTATEKAGLPAHEKRHCQSLSEFATNCRHFLI